jgi:hypothetical protein
MSKRISSEGLNNPPKIHHLACGGFRIYTHNCMFPKLPTPSLSTFFFFCPYAELLLGSGHQTKAFSRFPFTQGSPELSSRLGDKVKFIISSWDFKEAAGLLYFCTPSI